MDTNRCYLTAVIQRGAVLCGLMWPGVLEFDKTQELLSPAGIVCVCMCVCVGGCMCVRAYG